MDKNRVRKGVREGGQFAAASKTEARVSIEAHATDLDGVATADADTVRALAESPDPIVRAELVSNPYIPLDVLERLQDYDQPTAVRVAAAGTGYAGTADRAARDPHPLVRANALVGWDLSEENRSRLQRDPKVSRVMGLLKA